MSKNEIPIGTKRFMVWGVDISSGERCFRNPIIVSNSIIFNFLYDKMERFFLIRRCMKNWSNHIKTLCTVMLIALPLCF